MLETFLKLEQIIEEQQKTIKTQQEIINNLSLENINLKQLTSELIVTNKNDGSFK
ncbi:hypothetical protein [Tepidibacter thalassicus]|uniref:Uncharacterized protein n=1 Tax=Tepidibacter thalassicus DSM 15285 TaxID=1123350 RepID=A0A1M5NMN2_9FIRM|nr:hypothetical protein [Tepidibacter thalassicus]SHG90811.1 hypothetical protein SAMN02744040_00124 [Tepidibacter thalassicus DSM 15285]